VIVRGLTVAFWAMFVLAVGWMTVCSWDYQLAIGLFGEKGSRLLTTLLMGGLAALLGLLVPHHRRAGGDEEYWTGAELVYGMVLFLSLFYGIYSFSAGSSTRPGDRGTPVPIRESRVTRAASSSSPIPSVPGGRIGRTM
jgi:hypothetical protein